MPIYGSRKIRKTVKQTEVMLVVDDVKFIWDCMQIVCIKWIVGIK